MQDHPVFFALLAPLREMHSEFPRKIYHFTQFLFNTEFRGLVIINSYNYPALSKVDVLNGYLLDVQAGSLP